MLVLSRKAGEKICIGDSIVIEVRRVAGNRVTIALEAPRDMRILRGELEKVAHEFEVPQPEPAPAPPASLQRCAAVAPQVLASMPLTAATFG